MSAAFLFLIIENGTIHIILFGKHIALYNNL